MSQRQIHEALDQAEAHVRRLIHIATCQAEREIDTLLKAGNLPDAVRRHRQLFSDVAPYVSILTSIEAARPPRPLVLINGVPTLQERVDG